MTPLIIENVEILPGESKIVAIRVSRLPSGTKINIKAHIYRSYVEGPTVLLLGGVHGDEINGIEVVRRLIKEELPKITAGTVIAISLLNVYGFINFRRGLPDGKDVNRSFPGSTSGSLASRVAACLTRKILPHVDFAIDFHTGGESRYIFPQIRYTAKDEKAKELALNFAPPVIVQKNPISKSFRKTANEMGIPVIIFEGGESERLCDICIEHAYSGTQRVLKYLGMLKTAPKAEHKTTMVTKSGWIRASDAGLFRWLKKSGVSVEKSEIIGVIEGPQADRTRNILASKPGLLITHNNASVVHHGDALFNIAYDFEEATLPV
jgi:predicted deacylase